MAAERLTPFMIFYCENKESVQIANPNAGPHVVSRMIVEQWKSLAPDKSRGYSVLSATYADNKKNLTPVRRKRERRDRDPKAPKSATSAYMFFSKHHRMLLKQENSELSFGDLGKTVGAMWKAATPEEKRPFEELAAEDRVRYLGELTQYKEQQNIEKEEQRCTVKDENTMVEKDEQILIMGNQEQQQSHTLSTHLPTQPTVQPPMIPTTAPAVRMREDSPPICETTSLPFNTTSQPETTAGMREDALKVTPAVGVDATVHHMLVDTNEFHKAKYHKTKFHKTESGGPIL